MKRTQLSQHYLLACETELQAFKPGNVSIYADGHDMTVADFRLSAEVSAPALCNPEYSLGEKIFYAVKATREAVGCNTNLGILLLCAPLVYAIQHHPNLPLKQALQQVLDNTTVDDADCVFKAITLASPGGLGASADQDVHKKATVTLTEAMCLASSRDTIALQYQNGYQEIFDLALPIYYNGLVKWGNMGLAALTVFVDLLNRIPDSHIERKYGNLFTDLVAARMAQLSTELFKTQNPERIMPLLYSIDQEFKAKGVNPGTTADLTVATVFVALLVEHGV